MVLNFSYISDQIIFEARKGLLYNKTTYKYVYIQANFET